MVAALPVGIAGNPDIGIAVKIKINQQGMKTIDPLTGPFSFEPFAASQKAVALAAVRICSNLQVDRSGQNTGQRMQQAHLLGQSKPWKQVQPTACKQQNPESQTKFMCQIDSPSGLTKPAAVQPVANLELNRIIGF